MILNRPTGIALIVFFTMLTNLFTILATLNYGFELLTLPVIMVNYILPILLVAGAIGVWANKQWGWWLLVIITGMNIVTAISYTFTLPVDMYFSYIMQRGIGVIIGVVIFYYLFNKNIFAAFSIPLEQRATTLKQTIGASVAGGLLMLLVLPSVP
ncbi:hypothetical protein [Thiomicrorhabdus sp.]|uniref:hypothetical protein n=1 Tax=Thiomicrorhabdus sp. TaxID=2039724 RepID=UPI0029C7BBAE|nr:hypothetical protein [Thiomicrorhabdus sp.]